MEIFEVPRHKLIIDENEKDAKTYFSKRVALIDARAAAAHHKTVEVVEFNCIFKSRW